MPGNSSILVIGAGVSGLATALRLAEAGYPVEVLAAEGSPRTTSDIAAAIWYPFRSEASGRARAWASETLHWLEGLAATVPDAGVTLVEGVAMHQASGPAPEWRDDVAGFRAAREAELPPGAAAGWVFRVPVVRMPVHLGWLAERLAERGVSVQLDQRLSGADLVAAVGRHRAVVNCSGLGARELVADDSLQPIRGQIVRVSPGYADRFVQAADDPRAVSYIIPRPDCTVLGGTTEPGEWSLAVDPDVTEAILERCRRLVPALSAAEILSVAVGLRPGRPTVRVEAERFGEGLLVHNYGHGGAGVTLSRGCASAVLQLIAAAG